MVHSEEFRSFAIFQIPKEFKYSLIFYLLCALLNCLFCGGGIDGSRQHRNQLPTVFFQRLIFFLGQSSDPIQQLQPKIRFRSLFSCDLKFRDKIRSALCILGFPDIRPNGGSAFFNLICQVIISGPFQLIG